MMNRQRRSNVLTSHGGDNVKCEYCDNEVPLGSTRCPSCGAAVQYRSMPAQSEQIAEKWNPPPQASQPVIQQTEKPIFNDPYLYVSKKSRVAYIVLAVFLGELGVHNFYAGYVGRGVAQLLITILSFGLLFWISWIWAFIELCVMTHDGRGVPFE